MDQRLYPISLGFFIKNVQPIIEQNYIWKGRPPEISHYQVFCAIMYMLRTGIPWRDLPRCYGSWHTIYQRFKRGSDKGIWWKIVMILQKGKKLRFNIVIADSTTFKVHRHGGGQKGGSKKSKGGMTTKLHLLITADCHVIEGFLTGGNSHDVTVAED